MGSIAGIGELLRGKLGGGEDDPAGDDGDPAGLAPPVGPEGSA
jgi:hypothetical protein